MATESGIGRRWRCGRAGAAARMHCRASARQRGWRAPPADRAGPYRAAFGPRWLGVSPEAGSVRRNTLPTPTSDSTCSVP